MPRDPLLGKVLDGKYELTARLGEGGMGAVYRAHRVLIGDEVAVKVLRKEFVSDSEAVERFRREARAAAALRHPNVVIIFDYGEGSADLAPAYIVMELIEGVSLRALLRAEIKLAPERAVALMGGICAGVGAAHRRGIWHRDLKPDNIIVLPADEDRERETVKVVDFGIAKLGELAGAHTLTQAGILIGTPAYMSPEQCRGDALDARSDVYSLGAVLFEMLTGAPPFTASTGQAVLVKHLTEALPPLPEELSIPLAVKAVILRSLAKDPNGRPPDATALGRELQAAIIPPTRELTLPGALQSPGIAPNSLTQPGQNPEDSAYRTIIAQPNQTLPDSPYKTVVVQPGQSPDDSAYKTIVAPSGQAPPSLYETQVTPALIGPGGELLFDYSFEVVRLDPDGSVIDRPAGHALYFKEDLSGVYLEMVQIPGGTFRMGSSAGEVSRDSDEDPPHEVTVPTFYMSKFQVTQAQWQAVANLPKVELDLAGAPSYFKGHDLPVEQVSWPDVMEFCERLSRHTGRTYRLPSEAEWEYACRAGTATPFHLGETVTSEFVNYDGTNPYGSAPKGQYRRGTTSVGILKAANAFGLYDMHGNVWEWCRDNWHDNYDGAPTNGQTWEGGEASRRVLRGGSWSSSGRYCRSAVRLRSGSDYRINIVGFRVVAELAAEVKTEAAAEAAVAETAQETAE